MAELCYKGNDPAEALAFFRSHRADLRALRRVVVDLAGATVLDINGDRLVLSGLTFGCPELAMLLKLSGASYNPATLHEASKGRAQSREFQVVRSDPWGHDRVL